jgi:hypothetical protein
MKTQKRSLHKNKTRKMRGGDKVDVCMESKCQLWLEQAKTFTEKFKKGLDEKYKKSLKNQKKICGKEKTEECEKIKDGILFQKYLLETLEKNKDKNEKMELDMCKKLYCNEGCKNTILEDGEPNKLPKGVTKLFKKNKLLLEVMKTSRKELFKDKKTVLKDNFYEDLKLAQIKKLQKEGAISGCVKALPK